MTDEPKHTYPSMHPKGSHWATYAGWEILDAIKPGLIPDDVRAYLAGAIAGRLMRQCSAGTVEQIAQWLHDETGHPDSYPDHTWPETERDDGRREGGWVKIVPQHAQAYFRDIARRMVAHFPLNEPQEVPDRQKVIDLIGYHFAALDPRARLLPHVRRRFDDACETAADAILALSRPEQKP